MNDQICGANVRGGGVCTLDPGHKKFHSTVTYTCDGCGKARRGTPHATARDGEYPNGLQYCFLCVEVASPEIARFMNSRY